MSKQLSSFGYQTNNLIGYVPWEKMRDEIISFFTDFQVKRTDTLLFYYSGHGVPDIDGDLYLATSQIDHNYPFKRGISFNELAKWIQKTTSSRVVVILDCCYSGSATLSKGQEEDRARLGTAAIELGSRIFQGEGRCILAASQALQEAHFLEEENHSLFTYYILQGLQGVDREVFDKHGNITVDTLSNYVFDQIMNRPLDKMPAQKPLRKIESSGDIILVDKVHFPKVRKLTKSPSVSTIHENTVTDKLSERFRDRGIDALTHLGSGSGSGEPDIIIDYRGQKYLCEAEWESSKFEGLMQVDTYSRFPESSGNMLILYPDSIKKDWQQTSRFELDNYDFKAYFFKRDQKTISSKSYSADELCIWIKDQLKGKERVDIGELVGTLRELVTLLRYEMPVVESNMSVFNNVLGITIDEDILKSIGQSVSAYLLMNQILFYQILSTHKPKIYEPIDENKLNSPYELSLYFDKVLEEDYQAIYSVDVVRTLTVLSLYKVATVIKVIRALAIEKFRPDIIGKVFHSLIPLDIRKIVAAYYTKEYAADILAAYAVTRGTEKIIDLACGSGTLLVAAYQKKLSLKHKTEMTKLHKKFLEEDITGLDIMPFSAHLSTINLALQQPLAETEFIRVGILDSSNAEPGTSIFPLRDVVPIAQRQQRIIDDYANPVEQKMVQEGAISLVPDYQHSFELQKVDVVIMNPPFTRQESLSKIGVEYKRELVKRFSRQIHPVEGKSSYYAFFIIAADKFLIEGGKLSFVLPAVILAKETDQAIRSFILKNYKIEGIITRLDGYNFSENTSFSEILFLCRKEKPEPYSLTTYISLKSLDSASRSHVQHILKTRSPNQEIDNPNFHAVTFYQNKLDETNLFVPVSLFDYSLFHTWKLVENSKYISSTKNQGLSLEEGLRSRKGGKYPECGISASDTQGFTNRDFWITNKRSSDNENITIEYRTLPKKSEELELKIPQFTFSKKLTCYGLRNSDNRTSLDVSDVEDRILVDRFPEFEEFSNYSELTEENISSNWKKWVLQRCVNLAVIETLHPEAPNTYFFAYFSEQPRAFSSKFWNVKTRSVEEAKVLVLWFNSSLNFIQLLINRIPTGWFKVRGYVFHKLKVPDIRAMQARASENITKVFDEVRHEKFPAMWVQFARNISKEDISPSDWNLFKRSYGNFEGELGLGFQPRKLIDILFIDILGLNLNGTTHTEFLTELYIKLLKEICLIQQSATEV